MSEKSEHIRQIWELYLNDKATDDQVKKLLDYLKDHGNDDLADDLVELFADQKFTSASKQTAAETRQIWQAMLQLRPDLNKALERSTGINETKQMHSADSFSLLKNTWLKWAAVLILSIGSAIYLWHSLKFDAKPLASATNDTPAPASLNAVIQLSDGRTINLDTAKAGLIAVDGNVSIKKDANGNISYHGVADSKMIYNSVVVPRGSKIASLTLSDGTLVYLNTASSLRYPVSFVGSERTVDITGEAYFEVAKNAQKRFVVNAPGMVTEVLGTKFNINAYADEESKKATLLQGSIKVTKPGNSMILQPGEQAILQDEQLRKSTGVNLGDVIAWKNGIFNFSNNSLDKVLRDVARWYDINIIYEGKVPQSQLYGKIGRDLSLNQVLRILADMNVKYKMTNDKTLIILSE